MPTPEFSNAITEGVRVAATAYYLPAESDPAQSLYVFGYSIVIANTGSSPMRLRRRRWRIIDAAGREEAVEGEGVVGQTPLLGPGEGFKYQSFCRLKTEWGTMEGSYRMERSDGSHFDAQIARFYLRNNGG